MFEKLHKFLGKGIRHLVERSDEDYVLRLNRNRVYYVRESLMRRATNVRRPCLAGPGCAVFWCSMVGGRRLSDYICQHV